jgi:hypothetical protein
MAEAAEDDGTDLPDQEKFHGVPWRPFLDDGGWLCPFGFDQITDEPADDDPRMLVVPERGTWRAWTTADGSGNRRLAHAECYRLWREKMAARRDAAGATRPWRGTIGG